MASQLPREPHSVACVMGDSALGNKKHFFTAYDSG